MSVSRSTLRAAMKALTPRSFVTPDPALAWAFAAVDGAEAPPAQSVLTEIATTADVRRALALETGVACWQITSLVQGNRADADRRLDERLPEMVALMVRR